MASKKPMDDHERFKKLFETIDKNKDGKIEVSELTAVLNEPGRHIAIDQAEKIIARADKDEDQSLTMAEFIDYMRRHERRLRLAFSDLDRNKDGSIDQDEVKAALLRLGLNINEEEAEQLTKRLDKDGSLSIEWEEWRSFLQLAPGNSLTEIVKFWRQSLMIDIGDQQIPPDFTTAEKKSGMWWRHLLAGGLAGAISRTCTAPLDRLKVLLQVGTADAANLGVISGFKHMINEGGVKSLWRGNGVNVLKIAPESALKFAAYEQIKKKIAGDRPVTVIERFAAGSSAGAVAQTCIYPMEVMKTRLAISKSGQYKGMIDCGMQIMKKDGLRAFYKGYLPNLIGIIPYAGIDLSIYETLKQLYIRKHPEDKDPGVFVLLACGTCSSTCGQLASYPLALIRTKLQAQAAVSPDEKRGMVALAQNILANEGPRGLYRGILPNFLKVLPAVSVSYVIYEQAKKALGISS